MHVFGTPAPHHRKAVEDAFADPKILYAALMDKKALWDPTTIDAILMQFPPHLLSEGDLFLALVECIANATLHGHAEVLGFAVRRHHGILLLSFLQIPAINKDMTAILALARSGEIPAFNAEPPQGLGFPILLRLAHHVTISLDRSRLQLWFRLKDT